MEKNNLREFLLKEAEIVQDIIVRMANNQFYVKGWAMTLIIATLLLKGEAHHHFLAFIPWAIFWYYDSYYLQLERLYRMYYDWLIKNRLQSEEGLLDVNNRNIEQRLKKYGQNVPCKFQTMFSKSTMFYYVLLLVLIIIDLLFRYGIV